ncbi:deoxyribose-phosphate aldolase [Rhodanobacter denitrificans]|uniref:deoxyribose-phosphate aldolase n=1 Tax=Rhodanobacter denitrificans TaxID=666685 RepID=UPI000260E182|nr:deoxyribose-phosphate aldolase [Rhodanobacter denitrificans]EIM04533.1 deoxyribose-phosphate aldolase [Rhodanobacter denitrificans]KZC19368.1 2-deoxyribose-5-phosphate aldolase [Rhodanobacter denitrificans]UJJ57704.1 deoxyribose-phosphate aldolase [Rhodanobacter denitrificans]UJM91577.1 deoxyribose-phosphate aldolase [Rhodanobacter denitrificans]UJN20820.1 deoxyribose-phosphate aldolase [Rhodanobacter denitrificans]
MPVSDDPHSPRALAARLLSLLDLTSLGESDTPAQIEALCASALAAPVLPAALCVYPEHVAGARRHLQGSTIKLATVVNFPDGGGDPARVERETQRALAAGADEIDLVLPYRALLAGDAAVAGAVVRACRAVCGDGIVLKLIVESGELGTPEHIRQACAIGLEAGVDFLKTSTGKVPVNASLAAAAVMLDAIAEAGGRCGFKAAGGIRTLADAAAYLDLAEARLGPGWSDPAHFRIGASALFGALVAAASAAS